MILGDSQIFDQRGRRFELAGGVHVVVPHELVLSTGSRYRCLALSVDGTVSATDADAAVAAGWLTLADVCARQADSSGDPT